MDEPTALLDAVRQVVEMLEGADRAQWRERAGTLEWSCEETVAHVATGLFWYAGQLATGRLDGFLAFGTTLDDPGDLQELIALVSAGGSVLARTTGLADPDERAFHFYGLSDPGGFAAMGIVETLVHGWDVARAVDPDWAPPKAPSAVAIARLFPTAPAGAPDEVLLWCTGRRALDGRAAPSNWRWDPTVRG